jgi:hypothetical protein
MATVGGITGGVRETIRAIGKARDQDAMNIHAGIDKGLDIILRKALFYCPEELGDLRATAKKRVTGTGMGTRGSVSFGGVSPSGRVVDYAIFVHEIEENYHAPPTTYKYLEKAVRESKGTITAMMKRQIQETGDVT